jgi:hypothetical protein
MENLLGADEARANSINFSKSCVDETLRELGSIQQTATAIAIIGVLCGLAVSAAVPLLLPALNEICGSSSKTGATRSIDPREGNLCRTTRRSMRDHAANNNHRRTWRANPPIRQVALIVLMAQIRALFQLRGRNRPG